MTVIFKNFNRESISKKLCENAMLKKASGFIKNNRTLLNITSFMTLAVVAVICCIATCGITVGVKVEYSGEVIAVVKNISVFENAKDLVTKDIDAEIADGAVGKPKLSFTLTVSDKLNDAKGLANCIIENSDSITYATGLKVNGKTVACVLGDGLENTVEQMRTRFCVEGAENTAEYVDNVSVEQGYFLKSQVKDMEQVAEMLNELEVKTVSVITTETQIAFETKQVKTSSQPIGYSKVTTAGSNGLCKKVEQIETINGVTICATTISDEVVTAPVTQVVTVGTAVKTATATERAAASSAGFICPISSGKFTISAYFGDGRNHKALDLAANKGTPIFAVARGTVTYAGYDSDYGYNIVIDHGNGMSTRYAHANALCVSKGAVVSQGDMIATVGSTGWSTGSHLHFEVIVNGIKVNPAPYIGLN